MDVCGGYESPGVDQYQDSDSYSEEEEIEKDIIKKIQITNSIYRFATGFGH